MQHVGVLLRNRRAANANWSRLMLSNRISSDFGEKQWAAYVTRVYHIPTVFAGACSRPAARWVFTVSDGLKLANIYKRKRDALMCLCKWGSETSFFFFLEGFVLATQVAPGRVSLLFCFGAFTSFFFFLILLLEERQIFCLFDAWE